MEKEIQCKIGQIMDIYIVIKKIIEDKKIDNALLKYKLLTVFKSIEGIVNNFNVIRNEKVRKYGSLDDEGNYNIDSTDKNHDAYVSELDEVLMFDEVVKVKTLKASEVFSEEIPLLELSVLFPIITDN